jgi:precorrin-6A/cobalt-precorrin-6A reductase
MTPLRTLILGGTTEAAQLARLLAGQDWIAPTLSLAGRTRAPLLPPIPYRIGGFGGADGLAEYLRRTGTAVLIDATHPYAARIAVNAAAAAPLAGVALLAVRRPPWQQGAGDRWTVVASLEAAAQALGVAPLRVFLTVGRQELAPFRDAAQHRYLIRSVEAPDAEMLPTLATVITARGPFDLVAEQALLRAHAIDVVVTKNAGGAATRAKIDAARALGLPVIITERPLKPAVATVQTAAQALDWLRAHHPAASTPRGA